MVHSNESSVLKGLESADLNPVQHVWGVLEDGNSHPGCAAHQSRRLTVCHKNSMRGNFENVHLEYSRIISKNIEVTLTGLIRYWNNIPNKVTGTYILSVHFYHNGTF